MNQTSIQSLARRNIVLIFLIFLGSTIRGFQLFHGLNEDYSFRQAQTAFVSLKLSENGLNLFSSPLPIFGPGSEVPFELPLFQNIVALLHISGMPIELSGRFLGLIFFQITGIFLYFLANNWFGKRIALVSLVLFEFSPFGLYWGASFLIEFLATSLSLIVLYLLDKWSQNPRVIFLFIAGPLSAAAYCVKITTAPIYSLLLVSALLQLLFKSPRKTALLRGFTIILVGPVFGLTAGLLWTKYADSVKNQQIETAWLTSSSLREWNFGSPSQYINPETYVDAVSRIEQLVSGPYLLTLLFCAIFGILGKGVFQKTRVFTVLLASLIAPIIFANLYKVHTYYISAIFPLLCIATAIGLYQIGLSLTRNKRLQQQVVTLLTVFLLFINLLTPEGAKSFQALYKIRPIQSLSSELLNLTKPSDKVILIGCDWNPIYLFEAKREGFMIVDHIYETPANIWKANQKVNYDFIARCFPDLDPKAYLPANVELEQVGNDVFRINQ